MQAVKIAIGQAGHGSGKPCKQTGDHRFGKRCWLIIIIHTNNI